MTVIVNNVVIPGGNNSNLGQVMRMSESARRNPHGQPECEGGSRAERATGLSRAAYGERREASKSTLS